MKRFLPVMALLLIVLVVSIQPISAQASIQVNAAWTTALQLTSLDSNLPAYPTYNAGDDYRYVDLRFMVTTTVQFWAVNLVCTFNSAVLDDYVQDQSAATGDWGDDEPIMRWWAIKSSVSLTKTSKTATVLTVDTATSLVLDDAPIGQNGVSNILDLGTMHLRVKPTGATPTLAGTSPVNCTASFLDRNGRVVVVSTFTPPAQPLSIITGYTVSGKLTYQGRTTMAGIGADCDVNGTGLPSTVTDAMGKFKLVNVRNLGWMNCNFYGNINNPAPGSQPDVYLNTNAGFDLYERGSFTFLPFELSGGNVAPVDCDLGQGGIQQCVNNDDVAAITGSWLTNAAGDANGDAKTDKSDLAIVASQLGRWDNFRWDHTLYGVATVWSPNRVTQITLGTPGAGAIAPAVTPALNTVDLWPVLSPDGSTIAFVRKTSGTPAKYELFKAPAAGGAATALLTKVQAANRDVFAPQWSQDGSRIGFICATGYGDTSNEPGAEYTGYGTNAGSLCLVDATGRNFRILSSPNTAKIFPPAWEGSWMVYGGTPSNPLCPNTLCIYDVVGNWTNAMDSDVPAGSDMPVHQNQFFYYRYTDVNGSTLRVIDGIDYNNCPMSCNFVHTFQARPNVCAGQVGNDPATPRPLFVHTTVVFDTDGVDNGGCNYAPVDANRSFLAGPFDIDYYDVSAYGANIMLYGRDTWGFVNAYNRGDLEDTSNGPCANNNPNDGDSNRCWPEWYPVMDGDGFVHYVDNMVGNLYWDGDPTHHSLRFAERDAVDWVP